MFITQCELCKRLNITHPTYNRLRRAGALPGPYPGLKMYWWPAVMAAASRNAGMAVDDLPYEEPLPKFLRDAQP